MHSRSISSFLLPGCLIINGEYHSSSMRLSDVVMRIGASQDSGDSEEAQVAAVRRLISLELQDKATPDQFTCDAPVTDAYFF